MDWERRTTTGTLAMNAFASLLEEEVHAEARSSGSGHHEPGEATSWKDTSSPREFPIQNGGRRFNHQSWSVPRVASQRQHSLAGESDLQGQRNLAEMPRQLTQMARIQSRSPRLMARQTAPLATGALAPQQKKSFHSGL